MPSFTDLTLELHEGMVGHPFHGRTPVRLSGTLNHRMYDMMERYNVYDGQKISFANEQWVLNGNTGTHMDSVWHADPDTHYTAENLPLECGYGPAVWLDCSFVKAPRAVVDVAELEQAESDAGVKVESGDIVLVHTGWSDNLPDDHDAYLNEHMGLTQQAGEWLRNRGAKTVGIDNATVETKENALFSPVHMNFLRPVSLDLADDDFIAIIENVVNIDQIPVHRFTFVGLPLPFRGGSGSPIRAIAVH